MRVLARHVLPIGEHASGGRHVLPIGEHASGGRHVLPIGEHASGGRHVQQPRTTFTATSEVAVTHLLCHKLTYG